MTTARWLWLPPVATAVLVKVAYDYAYEVEDGSRAGAEPVATGLIVALPFAAIAVLQLVAALAALGFPSRESAWVPLGVDTALAVAGVVLVVAVFGTPGAREVLVVAGFLGLPLLPVSVSAMVRRGQAPTARHRASPAA